MITKKPKSKKEAFIQGREFEIKRILKLIDDKKFKNKGWCNEDLIFIFPLIASIVYLLAASFGSNSLGFITALQTSSLLFLALVIAATIGLGLGRK